MLISYFSVGQKVQCISIQRNITVQKYQSEHGGGSCSNPSQWVVPACVSELSLDKCWAGRNLPGLCCWPYKRGKALGLPAVLKHLEGVFIRINQKCVQSQAFFKSQAVNSATHGRADSHSSRLAWECMRHCCAPRSAAPTWTRCPGTFLCLPFLQHVILCVSAYKMKLIFSRVKLRFVSVINFP